MENRNLKNENEALKYHIKELEEEKNKEKKYFDNILNSINDGICICDPNLNIIFLNKVLRKIYGKVNNKKCFEYFFNRKEKCSFCNFDKIIEGETIKWEWISPVNNKTYEITESPLVDKDGSVLKIKIFRDITDRKKKNERIKDLAKFPIENPNPVIRITQEGKILFSNEAGIELLKHWSYNVGGKIRNKEVKFLKQIYISRKNKTIEIKYKEKYFSLTFVPVLNKNYINIYGLDITEWKQLEIEKEKKLRQNHNDLKREVELKDNKIIIQSELVNRIFDNTHISIAYFDTNFNFIRVNNAYAKADNKSPDFFIGKNHFDLFPNKENEKIFKKVVKSGKPYFTYAKPFEYEKNPERGVSFWDWSLVPVKKENNEIIGLILTLLNVTDRIQNQIKLDKTTKELVHAKKLSDIGKLAATVAHELRNPLAVIEVATYNIEKKCKNSNIDMHIGNIGKKINEAERIISDLLTYAKIKMPVFKEVKIIDLLDECILNVKKNFPNNKVHIIKNYNIKNTEIMIDSFQIEKVFTNILMNAFQALESNQGNIKIDLQLIENNFKIIIEDSGIGINENDLDKIFEPFFTKKNRGTGLGLAICKEIITLHKGAINVISSENVGTKVEILLPNRNADI